MADTPKKPHIDFAKRQITSELSTFNTISALHRLDLLIEDAKELDEILSPLLEKRLAPAFHEFVVYYQVGFVTCLEWHAKSRLFDLLHYYPSLIAPDEIRSSMTNPKILDMATEKLTVPHIIAGSGNVSTLVQYTAIFSRILKSLGSDIGTSQIFGQSTQLGKSTYQLLEELYESRNLLVHEISLNDIGHRNIREFKDLKEIVAIGEALRAAIKSIETQITRFAPNDFPNLLDEDHNAVAKWRVIELKILEKEAHIRKAISEGNCSGDIEVEEWDSLNADARAYIQSEADTILHLNLPGRQYFDARSNLLLALFDRRFQYLEIFEKEVIYEEFFSEE